MDVVLKRVAFTDNETVGVLMSEDENRCFFVSIERPWKNNQHFISCIPPGVYTCKRINSPKHGDCFQVMNVPNRDSIEIHSANIASQLEGCIALGIMFGDVNGKPAIMNSKQAIASFMKMQFLVNEFKITIVEFK